MAQGVGNRISGTNTIRFIAADNIPNNKIVTYGRLVSDLKPHKTEEQRVRLTVGGDRIDCPYDISILVDDLATIKIHLNNVISTHKSEFFCTDIRNFYLNNDLPSPEYTRLPIAIIPEEIIAEYNLLPLVKNEFVYILIQKGMYSLPQAGKLANDELIKHLAPFGYQPTTHTPGLWRHKTRNISFVLTVDDFGINYTKTRDATHLLNALRTKYELSTDWTGSL